MTLNWWFRLAVGDIPICHGPKTYLLGVGRDGHGPFYKQPMKKVPSEEAMTMTTRPAVS